MSDLATIATSTSTAITDNDIGDAVCAIVDSGRADRDDIQAIIGLVMADMPDEDVDRVARIAEDATMDPGDWLSLRCRSMTE